MGEWDEPDASPIEDIRRAMAEMRNAPVAHRAPYYAGHIEYDWLIRQGMNPDHVKLMEPLHIGLDLASERDFTAVSYYDEMGHFQYLREHVHLDTAPAIGERRLPSPKAAQKAIAKRKAQKRARKR